MSAIKVWYLYNSSFAIDIEEYFLIFDYFNDVPSPNKHGLQAGVIDPNEITDKKVFVFVSHRHADHYNPLILNWREQIKDIAYILSSDIKANKHIDTHFLKAHEEIQLDKLKIKSFLSNDEGLAFHINLKDINLFFSGDLNWWKWDGEPQEWIDGIEKIYFDEMEKLKSLPVDIAFIPVDPRLEENYVLALEYFTNIIHPKSIIFPMHFSDQFIYLDYLKRDGYTNNKNIKLISHRGEVFCIK